MFKRELIKTLREWRNESNRKPLILRGARQVGKTSLVHLFGEEFDQYIYLNLELPNDRKPFQDFELIDDLVQAVFLVKQKSLQGGETLFFIDEIQAYPQAITMLRYFKEKYPQLYLIAAGSLLESVFDVDISFPVGRVSYLPVRPLSFVEFLTVTGHNQEASLLNQIPLPNFAHVQLLQLFHTYTLIGGMPEIVAEYANNKDISELQKIYDGLLVPYMDDVTKYATNTTQTNVIRHIIKGAMQYAGQRITFEGFGNSNYKSREVGDAFRTLEKTFFLKLIYPITNTGIPISPNIKRSPRLQVLDTGLVNYFSGIQATLMGFKDLNDAFRGRITEHIVYQELLAQQKSVLDSIHFWVRDKKTSSAEVDVIVSFKNLLVPVEIKSGAAGKLRSLHQYINQAEHNIAVRLYAGNISVENHKTIAGKEFTLLNLPYFAVGKLQEYMEWAFNPPSRFATADQKDAV